MVLYCKVHFFYYRDPNSISKQLNILKRFLQILDLNKSLGASEEIREIGYRNHRNFCSTHKNWT